MITYIMETANGELYCGKTHDLKRRMNEHKKETSPRWFSFKSRKKFQLILKINGDFEKEIKRFGIKRYIESIDEVFKEYRRQQELNLASLS